MVQLSFEPALDPYHTMFRALRLMPIVVLHLTARLSRK